MPYTINPELASARARLGGLAKNQKATPEALAAARQEMVNAAHADAVRKLIEACPVPTPAMAEMLSRWLTGANDDA
jgi:hypothetical protein